MTEIKKGVLLCKIFSIEWKIEDFFADCQAVGDFYTSPVFPINYLSKGQVTKWHLRVYPKGEDKQCSDRVSLYLYFESEKMSRVTVDYELSIVCKHNNLSARVEAKTFEGPQYWWGWKGFAKQDVIKDTENGALIDGSLTISCKITFNQTPQDVTESFGKIRTLDEVECVLNLYEELFESGRLADVTFSVQDNKIPLHKAILSCQSPVFKAMFEHEMKEKKESFVVVKDIDYEVMKELFRFIYSGKVKNIEKLAIDLLVAADKYSVTQLKALCEKTLYAHLTIDNAVECLTLTDICETNHLKPRVIKFVAAHYKDMVDKPGFAELNGNVMYQIIRAIAGKD